MSVIDIVLGAILIWAVYKGFTKGIVLQLATFAALLLGIFGGIKFSGFTSSLIEKEFNVSSQYLPIISFAITFIAIVVLVHLLAKLIDGMVSAVALSTVNRLFGAAFALLKYAFVISVLIVIVESFNKKYHFIPKEKTEASILYKPLSMLAPKVFPYLDFNKIRGEMKSKLNMEIDV